MNYFEEAYYYIPIILADKLQRNGYYAEALDWYRLVYDYSIDSSVSRIFPRLEREKNKSYAATNIDAKANDIENPHTIARMRPNAFTRYTIAAIGRCLIEFGDDEFTKDTSEALAKAHSLYEKAVEILSEVGFNQSFTKCELAIDGMNIGKTKEPGFTPWLGYWSQLTNKLAQIKKHGTLSPVITQIENRLKTTGTIDETSDTSISAGLKEIETYIDEAIQQQGKVLTFNNEGAFTFGWIGSWFKLPAWTAQSIEINYNFAIPRNPVKDYLIMYAEVNLFKMRNCMNISGMVRSLDVYAIAPDSTTGMTFMGHRWPDSKHWSCIRTCANSVSLPHLARPCQAASPNSRPNGRLHVKCP